MAITLLEREQIQKVFIAMLNAAPSITYLDQLVGYAGRVDVLARDLGETSAFKSIYPVALTNEEFANKFVANFVGNTASAEARAYVAEEVVKSLEAGVSRADTLFNVVVALQSVPDGDATFGNTKLAFENKVKVANYYAITLGGTATDLALLQGLIANVTPETDVSTPEALQAAIEATPAGTTGQTFMLTKGLDNVPGTSGNDTILGAIDGTNTELQTLSSLDVINGGAGVDTLKVSHNSAAGKTAAITLGNLSNVEVVEIDSTSTVANDADVNTSTIAGVTNLNYIRSAADFKATVANTTDVSISGATAGIAVDGGKNITVTDATVDQAITLGATTKGAVGTITVTDTKVGTGAIAINGGTDVTVNLTGSTATGDLKIGQGPAAADKPTGAVKVTSVTAADVNADTTQHDITITGGSTVEVTQTASSTKAGSNAEAWTAAVITQGDVAVAGANGTTSVTVNQTKSTAAVNAVKAVAGVTESASVKFGALKEGQSIIIGSATKDGNLDAGELKFTAAKDLNAEEVAQAFANLTNPDAQAGGKVVNGTYSFAPGTTSFTTWTSGAATGDTVVFSSTAAGPQTDLNAKTLPKAAETVTDPVVTPTNGVTAVPAVTGVLGVQTGTVTIDDNATAAAAAITTVTLDGYGATGIGATKTLSKLATLNLSNSGSTGTAGETDAAVTVNAAGVATLALNLNNVQGAVSLDGAADNALKTLNVTTSGVNSTFGLTAAAVETLTVAGDKVLDIDTGSTLTALKTVTVTGSAGLSLGAPAALTSVNTSATTGAVAATIDGTKTTYTGGAGVDTVTLTTGTALTKAIDLGAGDDTLSFAAVAVSGSSAVLNGGDGIDTLSMNAARAVALGGATQTFYTNFERLLINDNGTGTVNLANLGFTNYVTTSGSTGSLVLNNLANNGTVVLTAAATTDVTVGIKDADTGATDVLNAVLSSSGNLAAGKLVAANVETVNISTVDTEVVVAPAVQTKNVDSLTLTADKATTVNLSGSADLTLTLTGSTAVTLVDASTMTGGLTLIANGATAGTEVRGGSGNDVLTASGENDVLKGNGGNDTFNLTDLTSAYGGAGADVFNFAVNSNLTKVSKVYEVGAGDVFNLKDSGTVGAGAVVTKFYATGAQYNPDTTTDVAGKVNAALAQTGEGEASWFNHNGNTYIVIDADDASDVAAGNADAYQAGQDTVIQIIGTFDLGTGASFNVSTGTLEIL